MTTKKDSVLSAGHFFSFVGKHSIVFHKWIFSNRKVRNLVSCVTLVGAALCALGMRCCKLEKIYHFSPIFRMKLDSQDTPLDWHKMYFTSKYKDLVQNKLSQQEIFHLLHLAHYLTAGDSN